MPFAAITHDSLLRFGRKTPLLCMEASKLYFLFLESLLGMNAIKTPLKGDEKEVKDRKREGLMNFSLVEALAFRRTDRNG